MVAALTPPWLSMAFTSIVVINARVPTGEHDDYGNEVYETTAQATTKGLLQPLGGSDGPMGRAEQASATLFLPAEVAGLCDAFAAFVVDGVWWEADGPCELWKPLFAPHLHHCEISVTRSTA
jgi:hypothetical protein